jgi:hypothetical protein
MRPSPERLSLISGPGGEISRWPAQDLLDRVRDQKGRSTASACSCGYPVTKPEGKSWAQYRLAGHLRWNLLESDRPPESFGQRVNQFAGRL